LDSLGGLSSNVDCEARAEGLPILISPTLCGRQVELSPEIHDFCSKIKIVGGAWRGSVPVYLRHNLKCPSP
jgi:hypothetical protein